MICPYYKNKEVFDGFNEIIEALGGKPMTEEEFRDSELRNLRTGPDFWAMEAAYTVYDRNGGNFLDLTPQGQPSILFLSLLDINKGDRSKAIRQKSNVYSDEFFNWFGDWTLNTGSAPKVKFYGATMGKTTASKTNKNLVDFDDIVRDQIKELADKKGISVRELKIQSGEEYRLLLLTAIEEWRNSPNNNGKTLVVSNAAIAKEKIFDNTPSLPSKETFVKRQVLRGTDTYISAGQYYDDLINKWMPKGFKTDDRYLSDIENVSKVVDLNGEPLVVWHGNRTKEKIKEFKKDKIGSEHKKIIDGFWFITNRNLAKEEYAAQYEEFKHVGYGEVLPVYLNFKNPIIDKQKNIRTEDSPYGKMDIADERFLDFIDRIQLNSEQNDGFIIDVVDSDGFADPFYQSIQRQLIAKNANQIKHVANLGTWSNNDNNIYHAPAITVTIENGSLFETASLSDFGQNVMSRLLNGEEVTSDELVFSLLSSKSLSFKNMRLAEILARHKIPVKLDSTIGNFVLASTETNNVTGQSLILINPEYINKVSKGYLGESILHEIVHAVTVNAINNPTTQEEKSFVNLNSKVFSTMRTYFPKYSSLLNNVDLGLYALTNEKEFAAVFITDEEARNTFFRIAKKIDIQKSGRFIATFKNFVNSIVLLFVNKNIFNTNVATLLKYLKEFLKHLVNAPTLTSNKISTEQAIELYDAIDQKTIRTLSAIEAMKYMQNWADSVERNNITVVKLSRKKSEDKTITYGFDDISSKLQIRIDALRTSNLQEFEKNKLINETKTQIDMFKNQQTAKYVAITATLKQIIPQLLSDIRELKNINLLDDARIDSRDYMYQMHSNIGMYNKIAEVMSGLIELLETRKLILDEYNKGLPDDQKITEKEMQELKSSIDDLVTVTSEGVVCLTIMRDNVAKDILRKRGMSEGNIEEIEEYISNTENPSFDDNISNIEAWFGAMDSSSNSALRILSNIVNRALKKADVKVIEKTTRLLELLKALGSGESVVDLYELFDDGTTTQYLVRKLNYGKFYKKYDTELRRINQLFSKILKRQIPNDTRVAPDIDDILKDSDVLLLGIEIYDGDGKHLEWSVRQAWNELKNKWLYENCERKYNKKYYNAWNKVPQIAKDALDSINTEIQSLLSKDGIKDEQTGHYRYDKLSQDDWEHLLDLWELKKLLRSDYDAFGNEKPKDSTEYKIAKALQRLNQDLYGDKNEKIKKDRDAWEAALNEEIKQCGGKEEYDKWKAGKKNKFNEKRLTEWHLRNSRLEFKKYENGDDADVFLDIEDAMRGFDVDFGKEYEDLTDTINSLLRPYRSQNGEVRGQKLPKSLRNTIIELYNKRAAIVEDLKERVPGISDLLAKKKEIRESYLEYEDTEYFKKIKEQLHKAAQDDEGIEDDALYEALLEEYGTWSIDWNSGMSDDFKPYRWLTRTVAIDRDKYMKYVPGDAWTERVDNEELLNKNFDESEGTSFVPKKELYDNSKQWNKIQNSPRLKALYEETKNIMHEANQMQSNRLYTDDYLLPGITGSIFKRMKNHSMWGKTTAIFQYIFELLGINDTGSKFLSIVSGSIFGGIAGFAIGSIFGLPTLLTAGVVGAVGAKIGSKTRLGSVNPEDFSQIGSNAAADSTDSELNTTQSESKIKGQYPDGRSFHILPQYYTRRLNDPSQISSDLVNIISNYYKMSCYYQEKAAVKDDCEVIVDFLRSRGEKGSRVQFRKRKKGSDKENTSRVFEAAEKFLEMNLYDMRRSNTTINLGPIELQWSKTASLWKNWTTLRNLGMNPKVAITGFLTTTGTFILEALTGQHYGKRDAAIAFIEVIRRLGLSIFGTRYIANHLSNDDLMVIAENMGVAGQDDKKGKDSNRWQIVQKVCKITSPFGMLSSVDFWSKSMIMVAILRDHRYVLGKFVSRADLRNSRHLYSSKKEFLKVLSEWEKAPTLYGLLKAKNHRMYIDDKYKKAFDNAYDVIKDRVLKTTEYADGMATDLQRASVTQSILGAFILIHKQYLPLVVQRYFGKRVYDYDTHQYKNGIFRTLIQFVSDFMQNNLLFGIGAGVFTTYAFFSSPLALPVGATIAAAMRVYGIYQHKANKKESKSAKQIWNDTFNDFETKKSTAISYANRYAIKNAFWTVIMMNLIVRPIVAMVCSIADDDDDDKWWLELLAYSMRSFEWEFYTAFRTDDMLNNFKSPTPATSILDGLETLGQDVVNTVAPQGNFLFDPSWIWKELVDDESNLVKSGAYKNWTLQERSLFKLTPYHNLWEQYKNSKAKRNYLENQIMRIAKPKKD